MWEKRWVWWITLWLGLISGVFSAAADPEDDLRREARRQTLSIRQGGEAWPVLTTEFFRVRYQPGLKPDPVACTELDGFTTRTLEKLDPTGKYISQIRQDKIDYYLGDDATVQRLIGHPTKGMADLAGRAVISSHFPHFHELAHLLVDILMEDTATQTLPVVQEGVACLLGGRWGRSPQVVLYTGWVNRHFGMGQLDDVLTYDAFHSGDQGADVAYPLGTMLCDVVRREAGWSGVLELNRRMSGSIQKVTSLTEEDIVKAVMDVCRWPVSDRSRRLDAAFDEAWPRYRRCGIRPLSGGPSGPSLRDTVKTGGSFTVWKHQGGRAVRVVADRYPVYLLSPPSDHAGAVSSYFAEHLPGRSYRGQRHGLRCSPEEIALYDFATNQLLATWVAGFSDESGQCGEPETGVVFWCQEEWSAIIDSLQE